jgi:hypothetical protein
MTPDPRLPRLPLLLLALLTMVAAALRIPGAAELPLAAGESGGGPRIPPRAVPLLASILAVPWLAGALARRAGAAVGVATGLLVATSPFAIHSARVEDGSAIAFLAASVAVIGIVGGWSDGAWATLRRLVLIGGCLTIAVASAPGGNASALPFVIADLGVGVALFALLSWFVVGDAPSARLAAAVATGTLAIVGASAAAATSLPMELCIGGGAAVVVAAAFTLGRLWTAVETRRAKLGIAAIALLPGLPSVIGEHQDGGRFPLKALWAPFAERRNPGEAVFATLPELASRQLAVPVRPLSEAFLGEVGEVGGGDEARSDWIVLLFDRGRPADGLALPPEFESSLELVAVAAPRRFDLRRHEARLYRRRARG